ncbi:unnamed protein product [Paramecium primaurelia]|uniref:Uncharacterized protein n=2 Tax=Paramecium TaxID=5884 RepID=A0A8S1YGJ8_9CILI|nr:unnamed protein product [Paramecium primaurelia]CAD8211887.1 unnamed protein product [Paramecium pentaurelia]
MSKQSKQYLSTSAPHVDMSQLSSVSPKKEFYDATKQLEAARRRISLLRLENEMREKKLQIQQQKQEQLNKIREDHELFKEYKQAHKEQVNMQLQNLVHRTRSMKMQQSQDKKLIQQNFHQMKQQEVKNIKEQSQRNEYIIRQNLDSIKQQKAEQKQQVQTQVQLAQQTIQNFRKQKYLRFIQEHQFSKSQHSMEADLKLQQIEELKKQEAYLLIKLDETTNQVNKLNQSTLIKQSQTTPKTASYS